MRRNAAERQQRREQAAAEIRAAYPDMEQAQVEELSSHNELQEILFKPSCGDADADLSVKVAAVAADYILTYGAFPPNDFSCESEIST